MSGQVGSPPYALSRRLSRRALLGAGTVAALGAVPPLSRAAHAAPTALPSIQFDIEPFLAPPVRVSEPGAPAGGTLFLVGPTYTLFLTAVLRRAPGMADRAVLARALEMIEARYRFAADGAFTHIAYGLPYFRRLPGRLVADHMPRLAAEPHRAALEDAVPGPTDVHPANPGIGKRRFPVPVRLDADEVLFTIRSDHLGTVLGIAAWLRGSGRLGGRRHRSPAFGGLFGWTSSRLMFAGAGLPRRIADAQRLPYAEFVHPRSPTWMGFADLVVGAFAPAPVCTFQGTDVARLTTEDGTGYFADSAVQVLSHLILDLREWYLTNDTENTLRNRDVAYLERVQYMYRPHDPPAFGHLDQFTDGGGPAFLPNAFNGVGDARAGLEFGSYQPADRIGAPPVVDTSHPILGHVSALQRTSRTAGGTPLHIRIDGAGFDALDVPDGSRQPKLQFSAFVPTADFFRRMRISQASVDLSEEFSIESGDRGLEPRITATRRQNFLIPSRRHRAFPLLELAAHGTPTRPQWEDRP